MYAGGEKNLRDPPPWALEMLALTTLVYFCTNHGEKNMEKKGVFSI